MHPIAYNILKADGYDGITHTGDHRMGGSHTHRVWIAFEPQQIKAVGNIGTFDPDDDDMLKNQNATLRRRLLTFSNTIDSEATMHTRQPDDLAKANVKPHYRQVKGKTVVADPALLRYRRAAPAMAPVGSTLVGRTEAITPCECNVFPPRDPIHLHPAGAA